MQEYQKPTFLSVLLDVLKFIGISLAIAIGIFAVVSIWTWVTPTCPSEVCGRIWSERMFWASLVAFLTAMPAILAGLNASRGYFSNPLTAGMDMQVARTIIMSERRQLSKRTKYAFRMMLVGAFGIGISALIDILTR